MWLIVLSVFATSALAGDTAPATSDLQVLPVPIVYPSLAAGRLPTEADVQRVPAIWQSGQQAVISMNDLPRAWQLQPLRTIGMLAGTQQLGSTTRWMIDGATVDAPFCR